MTMLKNKFSKAITMLLWFAALAVLTENIFLYQQNHRLLQASAPQIAERTQLQMLSAVMLDGRIAPMDLPATGSKLLVIEFSPGCPSRAQTAA